MGLMLRRRRVLGGVGKRVGRGRLGWFGEVGRMNLNKGFSLG